MADQNSEKLKRAKERMILLNLKSRDIKEEKVLKAMAEVPREAFVPEKYKPRAYEDNPLPIGTGQTISQPYIVAKMTQELQLDESCDVLEIGTGCGYQAAVLAKIAKKVYTVERHHELMEAAQANLEKIGIGNVEFHLGDGSKGWHEDKKFDRIIVTACMPSVPDTLIDQLKNDGILIAPVGSIYSQMLVRVKNNFGQLKQESLCGVRFVRMIGEHGFDK